MMVRTNRTDRFVFYDTPASDPEQLHTPVCDWNGRTVHFINDAKYTTDLSEDWKNYWVKLKVKFKLEIPPGTTIPENVRLILYIYDPDGDQSGFSEPTNLYAVFKLNHFGRTGLDGKDCDDNQPEGGVFRSDKCWSGFDLRDIPEATVEPPNAGYSYIDFMPNYNFGQLNISLAGIKDKIVSNGSDHELTVYFRTCRHGGNNYRIKDIIGVPSCFRWYELTEQNGAVKPLEVWKKYPVFVTFIAVLDRKRLEGFMYPYIDLNQISKYLESTYDDAFIKLFIASEDINDRKSIQISKDKVPNGFGFASELEELSDLCNFHQRSKYSKNNIHIMYISCEFSLISGFSTITPYGASNSNPGHPYNLVYLKPQGQHIPDDLLSLDVYNTIHETGHNLQLNHETYPLQNLLYPKTNNNIYIGKEAISVMNYTSDDKDWKKRYSDTDGSGNYCYIWNYADSVFKGKYRTKIIPGNNKYPVLWFHLNHNRELRQGNKRLSADKSAGFYYWRSQP